MQGVRGAVSGWGDGGEGGGLDIAEPAARVDIGVAVPRGDAVIAKHHGARTHGRHGVKAGGLDKDVSVGGKNGE